MTTKLYTDVADLGSVALQVHERSLKLLFRDHCCQVVSAAVRKFCSKICKSSAASMGDRQKRTTAPLCYGYAVPVWGPVARQLH